MRNLIFVLFVVIMIFVIQSCESSTAPLPEGAFEYTSFDSLGIEISTGWISFEIVDSSYIEGEWKINQVGNSSNTGLQVGEGILLGSFIEGKLNIELNPNFVDNNVSLIGDLDDNIYSGKWAYSSFIGLTNWGTFEAVRR